MNYTIRPKHLYVGHEIVRPDGTVVAVVSTEQDAQQACDKMNAALEEKEKPDAGRPS